MRKLIWVLLLFPLGNAMSQNLHITARGGFTGYQGDLQGKRFTLDQTHFGFGLGVKYDITGHWSVRSEFNHGRVEAHDKYNEPKLRERNLSFQSKINELNVLVEYSLFDLSSSKFTPYVFAGVGFYHFNPYAYDTLGNKVYLRPLSTEGQGLPQYTDRKEYRLTQFSIPFGGGIRYKVADNISLGYELGLRKLFTDYLDDVSFRYVDQSILAEAKGAKAVEMAFRSGELKNSVAVYPEDGTMRGGSEFKDWYYFHGITLTFGINTNRRSGISNGDIRCPRPVL